MQKVDVIAQRSIMSKTTTLWFRIIVQSLITIQGWISQKINKSTGLNNRTGLEF